jgi:hypothetical protein
MTRRSSPVQIGGVPWSDHREAALALLSQSIQMDTDIEPKVANFLGSCCGYRELTPRMTWWLERLLREGGLPPLASHESIRRKTAS